MPCRYQVGRSMTKHIACFLTFTFMLALSGMAYCQQAAKSPAEVGARTENQPRSVDRATLIVFAPVGPVFVDMRLTVSKVPYREWVAQFLAKDMDVDKSGRLDASELNLLTESIKQLIGVQNSSDILKAINAASENSTPSDQTPVDVAVDDFTQWLRNRIPRAFDLIAQPQAADDAVRLASLVDIDHDGAISEEELRNSARTLRFRDLDNDETFSVSELLPYRDPRSQNAAVAPDAVSLPFFHVIDRESAERATERIAQRYGKEGIVPLHLLRQTHFNQAEAASSDKSLTGAELLAIVENPQFHMVMEVGLSVQANTSTVKVAIGRDASEFCKPVAKQVFGEYSLAIDGLPLKVQALGGAANDRRNTQGYLGQTFVMSDVDKNQYLDEGEFSGMIEALTRSGVQGDFAAVDFNGDKMVTRDEVFSFAKRDQMAVASKVQVSVKQDGKTLFGILDKNTDRRLSVREMRSGAEFLKPYDFNGDNKFADSELGTEFVLAISLGRPEFRRTSGQNNMMSAEMNSGDAILPGMDSLDGPEWFRRMDRNQDGDVSAREFLGTKEQFTLIDSNRDELLSAVEATNIAASTEEREK